MLKAVKAIAVGVGIAVFGIIMIVQGLDSDKPETGFIGLVAMFMGLFGALGGVRMISVPASVGGSGRKSIRSKPAPTPASIENEIFGGHRRVILPHDSRPPLPFQL
ncbi:MAG: hypothetical protein VX672_07790 [Planctomycetota bacterium]|nr:hypothetical protein [Planctomycetota bacterium]